MNTILMYIIGALLLACGVFAFLWQKTKADFQKAITAGIVKARDTEQKATEGMINDIEKENKVTGSIDDGDFLN